MSVNKILEKSKQDKFKKWFEESIKELIQTSDSIFKCKNALYGATWLVKDIDWAVNNCFHKWNGLYLMKQRNQLDKEHLPKIKESFLDLYNNSRIAQLRLEFKESEIINKDIHSVKKLINLSKEEEFQKKIFEQLDKINSKILNLISQRDYWAAWILGDLEWLIEMSYEKILRAISILESNSDKKDKEFWLKDSLEDLMVYSVLWYLYTKIKENPEILID